MSAEPLYSLNGDEPPLVGQRCTGLVVQQFHEGQVISDQVNVAYLRLGEAWVALAFECATIFWRPSEPPLPAVNDSLAYGLLFHDLGGLEGVVGQEIQAVAYAGSEDGDVRVTLTFANGNRLDFAYSCSQDSTRLSCTALPSTG